ncbi:YjbQ family protein [Streptomyces canus]|uniref:YjbQ family protein n=1 Tax=Streptomyces canus TaxID=58343 RepID=UPI00225C2E66|nr:YjbQ family protein [Streptomyces canus]MCX4852450.1 YjbQ family protein [Streptomyces canus]WSW32336.1 YjbQ family protein [Streptomyces canus]
MADAFTTRVLNVASGSSERIVDLTGDCEAFLREVAAGRDGLLNVFIPHATAGVALIETGAGSDDDLLAALHALLPADDRWQHRHGSPGHGRDHVLPAIVPPHATLPVVNGQLELGTWQSVCLVDTNRDNPRRKVRFTFLAGS